MGQYAGFQSVKLTKPTRSAFDLGHFKRLTTRMGRLTPILLTECVPSDTFRGSSEVLMRLAPLLAPIYDQIQLYVHFFFVPNRLLWEEWEEFITGGRLGVGVDPLIAPLPPSMDIVEVMTVSQTYFEKSSLADYLGVPALPSIDPVHANWADRGLDVMPFAAYQLVWYEYYRDRNFVSDDVMEFPLPSGELPFVTLGNLLDLQKRNYMHDYFTSALPFTQRGEEVLMPIGGALTVEYLDSTRIFGADGLPLDPLNPPAYASIVGGDTVLTATGGTNNPAQFRNIDEITFDGSTVSINDFRAAYALQVWLERNAIGGSRYTESTQAHFGVKPQDSRLQRPEYIGGGRINVQISEVVASNWSNDGTADVPQANMAGHGITYGNTNQFNYFCVEHGFIIGIASIMNPPSYQQGLPRMFRRRSFLDYPWPTFSKLGEQSVFDYEIYCNPDSLDDGPTNSDEFSTFGYQSRYADWKYICSTNHGDFKDTLLFWTLTRVFDDPPVLNVTFNLFDDSTQDRIFAVPATDSFWLYVNNKVEVRRPLPYFGTPNTMGFS